AWANDVERLGMFPDPDVVENQQRGPLGEELAQPLLTGLAVVELAGIAQLTGEPTLQLLDPRLLSQRDPADVVPERPLYLGMMGQGVGEHALADTAHALHPHAGGGAGDDRWRAEVDEEDVAQGPETLGLCSIAWR